MQTHFQLFTENTLQEDEAAIMEVLSGIAAKRLPNDIRLLNYYKELPVIFDASIELTDRGVVEMKVHDLQAAAMTNHKQTFIKSSHLKHDVIAKVLKIRKNRNIAMLANFQYVLITAERRICVRVRVSEKYDATFHYDNKLIQGVIEDISFAGLSIAAPKEKVLMGNVKGVVSIELSDTRLEIPGMLLKVNEDDSANKFIIELEVDARCEQLISQFIYSQQSRIIRELKDKYMAAPEIQIF